MQCREDNFPKVRNASFGHLAWPHGNTGIRISEDANEEGLFSASLQHDNGSAFTD